ncbi:MAG: hypothetical protein JO303_05430 [Caulobacteraceae bacterium]|nr:hypothetical protein [Caulobacteraceae bacterium]
MGGRDRNACIRNLAAVGGLTAGLMVAASGAARADEPAMGAVVLDCAWTAVQGVNDCKLVSETPAGLGLGAAAISSAEGFNLVSGYQPPLDNGRFRIRIGVKLPQGAAAAPRGSAG